jgi:hypothetical protein
MSARTFGLCLFIAFLSTGGWAESSGQQYSIRFRDDLKIENDLRLLGSHASSTVRFDCETAWKPVNGSELHLFIEHSPNLDSNRSFISVTLNYGILRSLRLDDQNEGRTEVVIPVPPEMLRRENRIVLAAEQFPDKPDVSNIWTAIKTDSFLAIHYDQQAPVLDLRFLPSPIVDPHSHRLQKLSVLLPTASSSETLEAAALVVANYANRASEPLEIHPVRSLDTIVGSLLIVGTPEEQPRLRTLKEKLPFAFSKAGDEVVIGATNGESFGESEGVIALFETNDKTHTPGLVVTGARTPGVARAAHKLILGSFENPGLLGTASRDVPFQPNQARMWKGYLPIAGHFTLAEMGFGELQIGAQKGRSLTLPLEATPDARFLPYGHRMELALRFSPLEYSQHLRVSAYINDSLLSFIDVAGASTGPRASIRVKVPASLLRQNNVLRIGFEGVHDDSGNEITGWLLPSSEFDLPREYASNLPDLSVLGNGFFPFGLKSDLSDTVIELPDNPGDDVVAGLLELSSRLGRLLPTDRLAFQVERHSDLTAGQRADSNIIALKVGELPKVAAAKGVLASMEERISESNPRRYVLDVVSPTSSGLRAALRILFSDAVLKQLHGDTALVYADRLSYLSRHPRHEDRTYSYMTHVQAWLRENWIALPVILIIVSGLLFVALRLVLTQYKVRGQMSY